MYSSSYIEGTALSPLLALLYFHKAALSFFLPFDLFLQLALLAQYSVAVALNKVCSRPQPTTRYEQLLLPTFATLRCQHYVSRKVLDRFYDAFHFDQL